MKRRVYECELKDIAPNLHLDDGESWGPGGPSGGRQQPQGEPSTQGTAAAPHNVKGSQQQNPRFSGCPG